MTLGKTGLLLVIACLFILIMPVATAAVMDSSPSVPLVAVSVPNILQEKSKLQYTATDFKNEGDRAAESGNYEDAVKYYNKAEEVLIAENPSRSAETDYALGKLEQSKGLAYSNWDGHDAESNQAFQKSASLDASAKLKREGSGKGCLIVTATFGSPLASQVQLVRSFRDDSIQKSYAGSRFMPAFNAWYYSFSPQVSMYINEHPYVKPAMQLLITPILQIVLFAQACYSFLSFNREIATVAAIIVGSTLYGLIYVFPATLAGVWVARRHGWDGGSIRSIWPAAVAWGALLLMIIAGVMFSLDMLTTIASGLFVIATIILTAGALSLSLSRYIGRKATAAHE
jgi:hypothetical protein